MSDLDIVYRVPCGFGIPGELPPPFPGGADGGIVVPPSPPDGPQPIDPSGPIIPPPDEQIPKNIIPTVTITNQTTNSVSINVNTNFTTYTEYFRVYDLNGNEVFFYSNLNSLVVNRPIKITGLTAGQTYTYNTKLTKPDNAILNITYIPGIVQGSFTTQQGPPPPVDLEISNFVANITIVDNSPILTVTFNTINFTNNTPVVANSVLSVQNDFGSLIYTASLNQLSNHSYQVLNNPVLFLPQQNYVINVTTTITGQTDSQAQSVVCPFYSNTPPLIPDIQQLETRFVYPNSIPTLEISFVTGQLNTVFALDTTAQLVLNNNGNNQVINVTDLTPYHGPYYFSNIVAGTAYILTIVVTSQTGNTDSELVNIFLDPDGPVNQSNNEIVNGKQYYNVITRESYNSDSEYDLKYTKYSVTPSRFLPTYGDSNTDVFGRIRHYSINRILQKEYGTFEEAILDSANISNDHIKSSLNTQFRKLYNLTYPDGIPIDETTISNILRRYIEGDLLNKLDSDYIKEIVKDIPSTTNQNIRSSSIKKSGYGVNALDLKSNRTIPTTISSPSTNLSRNRSYGESLIFKKMVSIDPNKYYDESRNLLQLWYTLPTDVNKRAVFTTSSGDENFYIQNTDSINAFDASGNPVLLELTVNDTLQCYLNDNSEINIPTQSDIDKANVLRNDDEHLIMYHLGFDKQILLSASCPYSDVEITSSVNPPANHYILKINTSTIQESPTELSPFIKETEANYTIVTSSTSAIQDFNDEIIFRAYPWLVLTISHDDPIWDYFDYSNSSVSGTTFKFTFRDVTNEGFGFQTDASDPFLVRKIPRFIVIMPTDRTIYNFYNGTSILKDWNIRELRWEMSPDKRLSDTGLLTHPFKIQNSFIYSEGESKSGEFSTQSYICRYGDTTAYQKTYKNPEQIPEREIDPVRAAVLKINEIKEDYNLDNGITWYDLLGRLQRKQVYTLNKRADVQVINKLKKGEKTGIKIFHVKAPKDKNVTARRNPTRIVSSKGIRDVEILYAVPVPVKPPIDETPFGEGGV